MLENWQSEYLQFSLFLQATVFFVQKGSPESKDEPGPESDQDAKVGRYVHGVVGVQPRPGRARGAGDLVGRVPPAPAVLGADLPNWQSEFLVVGSPAVFAVYLRARGATESKPVGTPHESTGVSN